LLNAGAGFARFLSEKSSRYWGDRVNMSARLPLLVGACFTATVTVLGLGYAVVRPRPEVAKSAAIMTEQMSPSNCQTVVTDPKPPLNVRSAPAVSQRNVIGQVENGTVLSVTGADAGWLRIQSPQKGWVHGDLTATVCGGSPVNVAKRSATVQVLEKAQSRFHDGDLTAALALAGTVTSDDPLYPQAQLALREMPKSWKRAEGIYKTAQQSAQKHQWGQVVDAVAAMPDIRYWRQQLTPIVRDAIAQQSTVATR
jgi:hypothetical protein